jgi:hypothetical protein
MRRGGEVGLNLIGQVMGVGNDMSDASRIGQCQRMIDQRLCPRP